VIFFMGVFDMAPLNSGVLVHFTESFCNTSFATTLERSCLIVTKHALYVFCLFSLMPFFSHNTRNLRSTHAFY
jgi:hypothetical protein